MNTRAVLLGARALIATPDRWLKGALGVDASGRVMGGLHDFLPNAHLAVAFCVTGALYAAGGLAAGHAAEMAMATQLGGRSILVFNEDKATTHRQVLGLIDSTVASLDGQVAA